MIIVETINGEGEVQVVKNDDGTYTVRVDEIDRHPNIDAEGVMRALGHYLFGVAYALKKLQTHDTRNEK